MAKGVEELKKYVENLISFGKSKKQIAQICLNSKEYSDISDSVKTEIIEEIVFSHPNYGTIQKIMRSDIVCDISGNDASLHVLDPDYKDVMIISKQTLADLFNSKMKIKNKIYMAKFEYQPLKSHRLIKNSDGTVTYNTYDPPFWMEDYFFSNGARSIPKVSKMPKMYDKFLKHFVNGDQESYDYIVKWTANALQDRNYCILATIGTQGIGKGVLGSIFKMLFGKNNFHAGADRMFKGTFNYQIANKRMVYCDEILIKSKEEEDKLKLVVNDSIEIERKGYDAEEIQNYANFYISSNNLDAIKITADDRRFSIVDLTDKKLMTVMSKKEIESLLYPENIEKLAHYLWHYKVNSDEMLQVFKSRRTEMVRANSLKEWEEWFVFNYCADNAGKTKKWMEVKSDIQDEFPFVIGRARLQNLMQIYPECFKLKCTTEDGKQSVWVVEFKKGAMYEI